MQSFRFTFNVAQFFTVSGILFLVFLAGAVWLSRHTDFLSILRQHLRRYAPFYFVVGPSAVTYFGFCGMVSSVGSALFSSLHNNTISQEYANQHGMYTMLHWIEYTGSFLGAFGFAWLIRWVGMPRLWTAMLFVSMSVCAAYRNARVGSGPIIGSGPEILLSPQWLDAIPVALGLGFFLLLCRRLNDRQNIERA